MLSFDELRQSFPLPRQWQAPTLFADVASVQGTAIHLVGLTSETAAGLTAIGSAADLSIPPLERAYFELLERAAIASCADAAGGERILRNANGEPEGRIAPSALFPASDEPERWRYARSNGVAVGPTWGEACERAVFELVERDRVLRSWFGEIRPEPLELPATLVPRGLRDIYDLEAFIFGAPARDGVHVVGVFGFPNIDAAPLICGLGARATNAEAVRAAWNECLQRLGFLWNEDLPKAEPAFAPLPDFHQEFFLWVPSHAILRDWLSGGHQVFRGLLKRTDEPREGTRLFADLTPAELTGRVAIAKAIPHSELPLTFGRGHPCLASGPPKRLEVHPVA
jgi:hypothetical protein